MKSINIREWLVIILFSIFLFPSLSAQQIPDSLLRKTYKELRKGVSKYLDKNTIVSLQYAKTYLSKARKEKDTLQIARGYYYKVINNKDIEAKLHLYDTIIEISKNLKGENYPTYAYYDKGVIYRRELQFDVALDHFLKALKVNEVSGNEHIELLINLNIAQLKLRVDKNEEALQIFKDSWVYVNENGYKERGFDKNTYYNVLFELANAYRKIGDLDSSRTYIKLGLKDEKIMNNSMEYHKFVMLDGVYESYNNNYATSEKLLLEAIAQFEEKEVDETILASAYYFLGENYAHWRKSDKAVVYFRRVDSLSRITRDVPQEYFDARRYIKDYFMFDIPRLKEDIRHMEEDIKRNKTISKTYYSILMSIIFLILSITAYQYKMRGLYKRRFQNLVENHNQNIRNRVESSIADISLDIPKKTIQEVLKKLLVLEERMNYTDPTINLNNLAVMFDTNSSYLSKIINHYKKESFSSYIKKLRINYAFNRLKTDARFRKYTIKAIAIECGFKTAESFSKIKQFEKSIM